MKMMNYNTSFEYYEICIWKNIVYLNLARIIYKYVNNAENQGRRFFFTMPVSDRGKMKQNADINHSYLCYRYMYMYNYLWVFIGLELVYPFKFTRHSRPAI